MDEMKNRLRSANPIWIMGVTAFSVVAVGGIAMAIWVNAPIALDAAELIYRTAREAVRTLA